MARLTKILDGFEAVLRLAIFGFYLTVVAVVLFQVVNRFWLHLPIVWTSDLAVICFIWLGFLTASRAVRQQGHFRMTLSLDLLGESWGRRVLEFLAIAIGLALFGLLAVKGYGMAVRGLREISPGLQLPMFWAYLALPVSAFLALLFFLESLVKEASGRAAEERARSRREDRETI